MWVVDLFSLVKSPLCNLWGLSSPKSSKVIPARHCLANYLKLFSFCWSFGSQPVKYDSELYFYNIMLLGIRQTTFSSQCKRYLPLPPQKTMLRNCSAVLSEGISVTDQQNLITSRFNPSDSSWAPSRGTGCIKGVFWSSSSLTGKWVAGAILGWNI